MKKLFAIICSVFFIYAAPVSAEIAVGITANFAELDTSGSETELTGDAEVNSASITENVVVPEIFVETVNENGLAIGLAYIPSRDLGRKSRTDTQPTGDDDSDNGDYIADAELKDVIQVYTDIPVGPVYAKLGYSRANLKTNEVSVSGTTYDNQYVNGFTVGVGYRGDSIPMMGTGFYKVEATYTDFDEYSKDSSNGTKRVKADTEVTSLKISVGTTF